MAGAPPSSSADFTPSWLKFNSTKQANSVPAKDNLLKHVTSCNKSTVRCSPVVDLDSYYSKKVSGHSTNDNSKAWPSVGLERSSNEKTVRLASSDVHKLSFSAVCSNQKKKQQPPPQKHYSMDVDFPTLVSKEPSIKLASSFKQANNVWNRPLVLKASDNIRSLTSKQTNNAKSNSDTNSIYRSLVPKSSPSSVKQPYRRTAAFSASNALYESVPAFGMNKNVGKKEMRVTLASQPRSSEQSIAKPRADEKQLGPNDERHKKGKTVSKTSCRSDGLMLDAAQSHSELVSVSDTPTKSLAFKAENHNHTVNVKSQDVQKGKTEIKNFKVSPESESQKDWWEETNTDLFQISTDADAQDNPPLSSSLEAEHRLLRQMGWTEYGEGADGDATGSDESPLTEAEIREFFLNNKKRGLLSVPSSSHRETAFRDALSAWILSGPPVMRRNLNGKEKKSLNGSSSSSCSVSSDFSHLSSCAMDSD